MIFHKDKKLLQRIEKEIPEFVSKSVHQPSNTLLIGLGAASLVSSAILDRVITRSLWRPVVGVWGPLFLILGLYSKVSKLEKELAKERSSSLH